MVKVTEQDYYMDGYLKENFDTIKKTIKEDWDFIFVYDGYEGSGKSLKAQQDAYYCDNTLNIDRITFTPEEFKEAIIKAEKYQAVIFDEAYGGLSARAAMTQINRGLISVLAEIRQKNLFIFIVLPSFFDLDRYVALWRSRALIHIYTDGFKRGYFSFFNQAKKKELYVKGKKFYSYSCVKPNFRGRFTKHYCVDEEEYKQKKLKALKARENVKEEEKGDPNVARNDIIISMRNKGYKIKEIADIMGLSHIHISRISSKYKEIT